MRDWNRRGRLEDFIGAFADWHFDWLDVAGVDPRGRDDARVPDGRPGPAAVLDAGRVTLLGDAAHPMVPRGSNGAGQAILDARALADALARERTAPQRCKAYDADAADAATRRWC